MGLFVVGIGPSPFDGVEVGEKVGIASSDGLGVGLFIGGGVGTTGGDVGSGVNAGGSVLGKDVKTMGAAVGKKLVGRSVKNIGPAVGNGSIKTGAGVGDATG